MWVASPVTRGSVLPEGAPGAIIAPVIDLLESLIATPSFSREEGPTADLIAAWLAARGADVRRHGHNVYATRRSAAAATLPDGTRAHVLLNSHHDTVRPAAGWAGYGDPFSPTWDGDKLTGLGSNDAGGPLVALLQTFVDLAGEGLGFDLTVAATAEEEISGPNGIASVLPLLPPVTCAVVGEPTSLEAAVAEKGLVVIDGETRGRSGHAARGEGDNALYRAIEDIRALRDYAFASTSERLGPVLVTTTQIEAGSQHNVVPDRCRFVVDVRTTDAYANEETVRLLRAAASGHTTLTPRSTRLQPSGLSPRHPLYRAAVEGLGLRPYGSPTLSDQALMPFPTLKLGPGDSARSHTAGEHIYRREVERGVGVYKGLLRGLRL